MRRLSLLLPAFLLICSCAEQISNAPPKPASSSSSISSVRRMPVLSASSSSADLEQPAAPTEGSIAPLAVPFTSQAPHANWGDPYQEACEEAAILMVVHYLNGTSITPEIADREILDLVDWETANGYSYDITAAQMAEVAEKKFGLNARVRYDVTVETIKEELAAGNPIVIPAAGRDLGNPYFSGEGPWYHALTIIGFKEGWTGDTFIVNDPGTKRGKSYEYDVDVLLNAIHDWMGVKEEIRSGKKAMVILER